MASLVFCPRFQRLDLSRRDSLSRASEFDAGGALSRDMCGVHSRRRSRWWCAPTHRVALSHKVTADCRGETSGVRTDDNRIERNDSRIYIGEI